MKKISEYKYFNTKGKRMLMAVLVVPLLGLGFVSALWMLGFFGTPSGLNVSSEIDIMYYSDDITMEDVDLTETAYEGVQNLIINNTNGERMLSYVYSETFIDDVDGCDYNDDVEFLITYNGTSVDNFQYLQELNDLNFSVAENSVTNVSILTIAERGTCPGTYYVSFNITDAVPIQTWNDNWSP